MVFELFCVDWRSGVEVGSGGVESNCEGHDWEMKLRKGDCCLWREMERLAEVGGLKRCP